MCLTTSVGDIRLLSGLFDIPSVTVNQPLLLGCFLLCHYLSSCSQLFFDPLDAFVQIIEFLVLEEVADDIVSR